MPIQMSSLSYSNEFHQLLKDLPCRLQYASDRSPELQTHQDVSSCTYMKLPFSSFRNASSQQQRLFPYSHPLSHLWLAHWLDSIKAKILNKEKNAKNCFSHLPPSSGAWMKIDFQENKPTTRKRTYFSRDFSGKKIKLVAIHVSLSSIIMIIFIHRLIILD